MPRTGTLPTFPGMELSERVRGRLRSERLIWLTTVRADGTPQSSLVWFLWDGDGMLIYSRRSSRVRNLLGNASVALNFNSNAAGGAVATFTGTARIDDSHPRVTENVAYLEKYRDDIRRIGHTPESFAEAYPVPVVVALATVRAWGN